MSLIGLSTIENLDGADAVGLLLAIVLAFGGLYHEARCEPCRPAASAAALYRPVSCLPPCRRRLAWLAFFGGPDAAQKGYAMLASSARCADREPRPRQVPAASAPTPSSTPSAATTRA